MTPTPLEIVEFWRSAGPQKWFAHSREFDEEIRRRFEPLHHSAARGEYDAWAQMPEGALALILVLDQFPRNLYRGSAHAFATDGMARAVARAAVEVGGLRRVEADLAPFMLLPFEHSEDLADQETCLKLAAELGDADTLKWARLHQEIIARFGRFPHRNAALGRATTAAEQSFLDGGGFAG